MSEIIDGVTYYVVRCSLRTQHFIQGSQNDLFKFFFVDCSGITDPTTLLQPAGTPPDNGATPVVIPVDALEHLSAVAADDHLRKAVCTAIHPLFTAGACLHIPTAYQFFLHLHVDFLGDNGFMVVFYIILRCNAVIGHTGLVQDIDGAGLLEQCVPDVLLIGKDFLNGAGVPLPVPCPGQDTIRFQSMTDHVHAGTFQILPISSTV